MVRVVSYRGAWFLWVFLCLFMFAAAAEGRYGASNRRLAGLTGLELEALGYAMED